jgi:hypothetical protein
VAVSGRQREPWIELDPRSGRVTGQLEEANLR